MNSVSKNSTITNELCKYHMKCELENNINAMVEMLPLLRYELSTNCRLQALEEFRAIYETV